MKDKIELINYSSARNLFNLSINYGYEIFETTLKLNNKEHNFLKKQSKFNLKLIQQHLEGQISAKQALNYIDNSIIELFNKQTNIQWHETFALLGRNNVFNIIKKLNNLTDEEYWTTIAYCYTTSELSTEEYESLKKMFKSKRPKKEFLMKPQEREYLNSLPEEITIFRGCSLEEIKSNKFGWSWTLDKKVAEFFAYDYRRNANIECSVVEKKINKSLAIAYFSDRSEEEILYIEN